MIACSLFPLFHVLVVDGVELHVFFVCRQSELSVKLNRQLERCLRNSKCIDTESLCVVSGEKVTATHSHTRERVTL